MKRSKKKKKHCAMKKYNEDGYDTEEEDNVPKNESKSWVDNVLVYQQPTFVAPQASNLELNRLIEMARAPLLVPLHQNPRMKAKGPTLELISTPVAVSKQTVEEDTFSNQSQMERQVENHMELQTETKVKHQTETKVETEVETEVETKAETQAEHQTETKIEHRAEIQAETQAETQAEIQAATQAKIQAETQAKIQTEIKAEIQTQCQKRKKQKRNFETVCGNPIDLLTCLSVTKSNPKLHHHLLLYREDWRNIIVCNTKQTYTDLTQAYDDCDWETKRLCKALQRVDEILYPTEAQKPISKRTMSITMYVVIFILIGLLVLLGLTQ